MNIEDWRGRGSGKYRVLSAIETKPLSGDAIWKMLGRTKYGNIGPTLNQAKKNGLVVQYVNGRIYTYQCTDAGREWLANMRSCWSRRHWPCT